MAALVLQKEIVIEKGTVFRPGPVKTEYAGSNFEASLGLTPDNTMTLVVFNEEGIEDYFEEVEE